MGGGGGFNPEALGMNMGGAGGFNPNALGMNMGGASGFNPDALGNMGGPGGFNPDALGNFDGEFHNILSTSFSLRLCDFIFILGSGLLSADKL